MQPRVINAKRFLHSYDAGADEKFSPTKGFGSSSPRDVLHSPKKSKPDAIVVGGARPKTPRLRNHELWDGYDPENPSSPKSPTVRVRQLADRRSPRSPRSDTGPLLEDGVPRARSPPRPRANSPVLGGFSTPAMNLDETFGSVVDGQSQYSAMQGQTADGTRWSNVDFETSLYADRRLGIDSDLIERRNGHLSPTFSSVCKTVWGPSHETPRSPVNMDLEVSTLQAQLSMQDDFGRVHSVTPSVLKHKTRIPDPDRPHGQHEYVHLAVSSPDPLRALRTSPRGHGPRAFFGDTIQDARIEPYGAVDGADARQMMAQTVQGGYSPVHHHCPSLGMVSVYNAVDSAGRGLLSTFKHHADPAQDWAMIPKAAHPYHEKARKDELKKPTDPDLLRRSQLQLEKPVEGEPLQVATVPRPISMSIPGHQVPHCHKAEGLKSRGQLADHVEKQHEPKHNVVESIAGLKAELAARDPVSSVAKPYSTPTPIGHEGRQGNMKQSDSLQAKIPLEHHNVHGREHLRQQLVRHEHQAAAGVVGHQHYAGHPHPTDGSIARCADAQGFNRKRVDSSRYVVGLEHRPDTAEGMQRRTDHLDLVAVVRLRREPTSTGHSQNTSGRGNNSVSRAREMFVSPARDVTTRLDSSPHGKAVRAGPPPGHFKVNHRGDLSFNTFHHDPPSGGVARGAELAKLSEPGQIVGYRANGSQICAVRTRPPERQVNTQSTATYVIHDEEHTWRRHSPGSESRDSTHAVVFAPPAENTPADHRAAVGAGPSKRAISPPQHKQGPTALSVHDRLYLTDAASSRVDPHRHGNDRPF